MKIVVTIFGHDRVGIVAGVSALLAAHQVNILDINQNIVDGFFNMIVIADMAAAKVELRELQALLKATGEELGVEIKAQHDAIFNAMHRI